MTKHISEEKSVREKFFLTPPPFRNWWMLRLKATITMVTSFPRHRNHTTFFDSKVLKILRPYWQNLEVTVCHYRRKGLQEQPRLKASIFQF